VADTVYNRGKYLITSGGVIWGSTDVRALLLETADTGALPSGAWDPDLNFVSDVLGVSNVDELGTIGGTGYVRKTMAGFTVTEDDAGDQSVMDANDITWTAIDAGIAAAIVVYKYNASDAAAELISIHTTNFPKTTNGGDLTVQWPSTGVITGS
jgi:hypothetical protein